MNEVINYMKTNNINERNKQMKTYAYDCNHKRINHPGCEVDTDPITLMECLADDMNFSDTIWVDEADISTVPEGKSFSTYPAELHLELPPTGRINGIWKFEVNGQKYRGNMRFTRTGAAKLQYIKPIKM